MSYSKKAIKGHLNRVVAELEHLVPEHLDCEPSEITEGLANSDSVGRAMALACALGINPSMVFDPRFCSSHTERKKG